MATPLIAAMAVQADAADDLAIVEQVIAGNTALFEQLIRRYNERLYRTVRSIVRDECEIEDVMQQTYLNAFTHLRQFNGSARFATWLMRIATNEALACLRRQSRVQTFNEEYPATTPAHHSAGWNPERQAFAQELRMLLEWAIDLLPDGTQEVFVLRDIQGLSTLEAAEWLGVSEDVVKTRLSRGRAILRRTLMKRARATVAEAFRFERPRCDRVAANVLAMISLSPFSPSAL